MIVTPDNKSIEQIITEKPVMGVSTGLKDLDAAILGLRPGHLVIIAAYSGVGKTSIMADLTLAVAKSIPVAAFSLEMGVNLFVERLVYNKANLNYHKGMTGDLSLIESQELKQAQIEIDKLQNIYIN